MPAGGGQNALLGQIQAGIKLKSRAAEPEEDRPPKPGMGGLLSEIAKGKQLRKVGAPDDKPPVAQKPPQNDLADTLAKAMAKRHHDMDSESEDSSDWDDS